jgi:hypothetical protein
MGKDAVEERDRKPGGRRGRAKSTIVDWQQINGEILIRAIAAISRSGGAIRLGYSRDGGAFAVGVYGDGEPYTEFEHDSANLEALLVDLEEWFTDNGAQSPDRPTRRR